MPYLSGLWTTLVDLLWRPLLAPSLSPLTGFTRHNSKPSQLVPAPCQNFEVCTGSDNPSFSSNDPFTNLIGWATGRPGWTTGMGEWAGQLVRATGRLNWPNLCTSTLERPSLDTYMLPYRFWRLSTFTQ